MDTHVRGPEPRPGWAVLEGVFAMVALTAIIVIILGSGLYLLAQAVIRMFG